MLTIPNDRLTLWSPEELAEALGVKEQTLADWRNARTGPAFIRTSKGQRGTHLLHIRRGDGMALNPPRHPHHQLRKHQ